MSGNALALIQTIEVTNENYEVAWSLLKERYTNKKLLVKKHVQALFDLPTIQKETSVNLRMLLDSTTRNLRILGQLGEPIDQWDTLVVHFVSSKFDQSTRKEWESLTCVNKESSSSSTSNSVKELTEFLQTRCSILESLESHQSSKVSCESSSVINKVHSKPSWSNGSNKSNSFQSSVPSKEKSSDNHQSQSSSDDTNSSKCSFCNGEHANFTCSLFSKLSVHDRFKKVQDHHLCFNCLRPAHSFKSCGQSSRCKVCSKPHHTLLHFYERPASFSQDVDSISTDDSLPSTPTSCQSSIVLNQHINHSNESSNVSQVFLSTAVVIVQNHHGHQVTCRMLLDSGSQSNFITEDLCQRLKLNRKNVNIPVSGITDAKSPPIKHQVNATLKSRHNGYQVNLNFLVLTKITGDLPSMSVDTRNWGIPNNITLADTSFNVKGRIDLLVGAELFHQILCIGRIVLSDELPTLQKTLFGWIVSGMQKSSNSNGSSSSSTDNTSNHSYTTHCNHSLVISNLQEDLSKRWDIEQLSSESVYTNDEAVEKPPNSSKICESNLLSNDVAPSIRSKTLDVPVTSMNSSTKATVTNVSTDQFIQAKESSDSNNFKVKGYEDITSPVAEVEEIKSSNAKSFSFITDLFIEEVRTSESIFVNSYFNGLPRWAVTFKIPVVRKVNNLWLYHHSHAVQLFQFVMDVKLKRNLNQLYLFIWC